MDIFSFEMDIFSFER